MVTTVLSLVTAESQLSEQDANAVELLQCVQRLQQGEASALEDIYERTVNRVYAVALALLENRADAEEVTEDVYVQAWNQAERFDSQRGSVQAWLTTICRSRAIDRLRSRKRQVRLQDALQTEQQTVDCVYEPTFNQESRLAEALSSLSDAQRSVLMLAYFRGLTHQEIAETLGLQLGTVKTHLRRALLALRTRLTL